MDEKVKVEVIRSPSGRKFTIRPLSMPSLTDTMTEDFKEQYNEARIYQGDEIYTHTAGEKGRRHRGGMAVPLAMVTGLEILRYDEASFLITMFLSEGPGWIIVSEYTVFQLEKYWDIPEVAICRMNPRNKTIVTCCSRPWRLKETGHEM